MKPDLHTQFKDASLSPRSLASAQPRASDGQREDRACTVWHCAVDPRGCGEGQGCHGLSSPLTPLPRAGLLTPRRDCTVPSPTHLCSAPSSPNPTVRGACDSVCSPVSPTWRHQISWPRQVVPARDFPSPAPPPGSASRRGLSWPDAPGSSQQSSSQEPTEAVSQEKQELP